MKVAQVPKAISNYIDSESHSQANIKGTEQERKSHLQWRSSSCILSDKVSSQIQIYLTLKTGQQKWSQSTRHCLLGLRIYLYIYHVLIGVCCCFLSLCLGNHVLAFPLSCSNCSILCALFLCSVFLSIHASITFIHSSVYLPIHTSQDVKSNIGVPRGYS